MAFCMKVAQGAVAITKCPYMSQEAIALLSEATAPPMKTVESAPATASTSSAARPFCIRHEKTLVSSNLFQPRSAAPAWTTRTVDAKLADMAKVDYERIGEREYGGVRLCPWRRRQQQV